MRTKLLLILFILLQQTIFAQECTLKGILQDENGLPINDASISLFNDKNEGVGFTYSDIDGAFTIKAPCNANYEVEIEHVQFEMQVEKVDLSKNETLKLKLKRGTAINLEEAIVKAKQAIKVKGDTIEYDADSFKIGNEEVLEDILKKLPGIVVENGKVFHNGKEIRNITVGGREVLGGNTKLLNKNLPSDAVDKIQLNKKFKSNPFASSLQEDEEFSLNIELKEDKKNLAFGNMTVGGNADDHADVQSKTFYFSQKTDATLIGDFNTYGKQVFDQEDYMSFFGVYSDFNAEGSIYSLRTANNAFSFLTSQEEAKEMNTFTGATHFGYEPNKNLTISGFGLVTTNNIRYNQTTERFNNELLDNRYDRDEERNKQNVLSAMGRLRLDYLPGEKSQLKYRLNINYTESDLEQHVNSHQNDVFTANRDVNNQRQNNSISQNLSFIKKVGRDHNIGFYLRHQYQEEKPDLWISSSDNFLSNIYGDNLNDIRNQNKTRVNTIQLYAVYNHLLTNSANLKLKGGTNFSNQNMRINTFGNGQIIANDSINGSTDFDFQQYYLDATLTKKIGKFKMDVGAGIHHLYQNMDFLNARNERKETKLFPHASFEFNVSNAQRIFLNYSQNYSYPSINDLNPMFRMNNFFSVFTGNQLLEASKTHTMNLGYYYFNSFSFFSLYANLGYTLRENSIQTVTSIKTFVNNSDPQKSQFNQFNTLFNSTENEQTWTGNFNMSKRFSKIYTAKVNGNVSFMDYYTFINQENVHTKNISQFYTLDNVFTIKKKVEISAGVKLMMNDYEALNKQQFKTWQPNVSFAWSLMDKWLLQSDFNYRFQYQNNENINEAKELNASVRYNIAKKTTLTLIGGNLLGNNIIVNNSFTDNYTQVSRKEVLGRYFLVNVRYKF